MKRLSNKRILVGVTGSIAAYKSADLVRRLREAGAEVRVVMTSGATQFITPLTLQTLSGNPVRERLLDSAAEAAMGHIDLARWADAVLVAPASADFLARLAQGRADDLLTALCLAADAPVAVAPAMNRAMWQDAATQDNCQALGRHGVHLFGPAEGSQACGETGPGRMLEPAELVARAAGLFETGALSGMRVMVTAGPTREAMDPVRFISNRSSGKMGFAMAGAAAAAGARVVLVSGPVSLPTPDRAERVDVGSAEEMLAAVRDGVAYCDIFIATAAVADYRPDKYTPRKVKRSEEAMTLTLLPNPDILAAVAALPAGPFTVGFAAETDDLEPNARLKLQAKGIDMIVANRVGGDASGGCAVGFESDENEVAVFWPGGSLALARAPKTKLARQLVGIIAERYRAAAGARREMSPAQPAAS